MIKSFIKFSEDVVVLTGKGQNYENQNVKSQKWEHQKSKICQRIRTSKVSIKVIRTSKDQNNDNYLWHITYEYQGLWGVG
jgi:hypothetical protein